MKFKPRYIVIVSTALALTGLVGIVVASRSTEPASCNTATEQECIESAKCTLVQNGEHGKYTCRDAIGHCEIGFRQAGAHEDIKQTCEAKPGCEFHGANCYCPPGLECFCGGGPPAQCVERTP